MGNDLNGAIVCYLEPGRVGAPGSDADRVMEIFGRGRGAELILEIERILGDILGSLNEWHSPPMEEVRRRLVADEERLTVEAAWNAYLPRLRRGLPDLDEKALAALWRFYSYTWFH